MFKIQNYIDGHLQEPISNNYIDNYDPSTGSVYSLIPDSDERDVEAAVEAAKKAYPGWSSLPREKRSDILLRIAHLIEEKLEDLAIAESRDNGKPVSLARTVDIPRAASNIKFYATAILHYASESHSMGDLAINYTLRNPVGIAGCISPWNLPLYLFTWKIAPALATGNCVVAKPSEITPMTAFLFSEICIKAGLPKGVLNIVYGYGHKTGAAISAHPDIPLISFTGGTKTGAEIARVAAPMFKKISLELGGKNPNIIFADCDYDKALKTTIQSSFSNQGQICLCGSRIYVERPIYEKFKNDLVKATRKLIVGDPSGKDTNLGAVVSKQHLEKILGHIEVAKNEGGRVLTGGARFQAEGEFKNGWYMEPTIIEGLDITCRTNQEEIFGPVVTIEAFDSVDQVIGFANATRYGLSSTIWTNDISKSHQIASKIHAGIVWINCWLLRDLRTPFGGVKNSGVGREGGFEALDFFTEPKNVCVKY